MLHEGPRQRQHPICLQLRLITSLLATHRPPAFCHPAIGRDSKPKLPVIAAATADLLGMAGQSRGSLDAVERAAIKAALAALA